MEPVLLKNRPMSARKDGMTTIRRRAMICGMEAMSHSLNWSSHDEVHP
jgi:hypothetical protein